MFWIWILVLVVLIVAASVFIGRALSKPRAGGLTHDQQVFALKASGALRHRKSNND